MHDIMLSSVAPQFWGDLDTPIALGCYLRAKYGEWDQLAQMSVDPQNYQFTSLGAYRFFKDTCAASLVKKYPGLPTSVDTKRVAVESFWKCEKECAETNLRLSNLVTLPFGEHEFAALDVLSKAKRWISRVVGALPDQLDGRFGPGSIFEVKSVRSHRGLSIPDKIAATPSLTPEAREVVDCCLQHYPRLVGLWRMGTGFSYETAPGNRFTTVPKDATKDRGICIEPGLNVFFQLGVGEILKGRLARIGLHIRPRPRSGIDGQTLHRLKAREASVENGSATIDLSNASDTVSRELVRLLLPDDWYWLLDSLRCHRTLIGGKWHKIAKFSSMGNGFTFELETLIFASLLAGCGGRPGQDCYVYGDDIIAPRDVALKFLSFCPLFGFTANRLKTYVDSPFRESCGGDYFLGWDTRPYFQKVLLPDPLAWISCANGIYRLLQKRIPVRRARSVAISQIPTRFRLLGPSELGDSVIAAPKVLWKPKWKDGIRWFRCVVPRFDVTPLDRYDPAAHLASALYGVPSHGVIPRGARMEMSMSEQPFS